MPASRPTYFARSPEDDIWVRSEHLPQATWDALRERLDREPVKWDPELPLFYQIRALIGGP